MVAQRLALLAPDHILWWLFPSSTAMVMVRVLHLALAFWYGSAILTTVNLALSQDTQCSESVVAY